MNTNGSPGVKYSHASSLDVICPLTDKILMISILRCAVSMPIPPPIGCLKTVQDCQP